MEETVDEEYSKKKETESREFILENEIGQFGWYQLRLMIVVWIIVIFAGSAATEYVFTAGRIPTRCLIPECENVNHTEWSPSWISNAIPASGENLDHCTRFAPTLSNASLNPDACPVGLFDRNKVVPCEQYVYERTDTIVYDYDMACQEWLRSSVGSLRTIGSLLALPLVGFVSDRWGRRTALVLSAFNTAWMGMVRYFAKTYIGFTISEIAEATFGTGSFTSGYILVMEMVGPKYRTVVGASLNSFFAVGQAMMALIAWEVPYWRHLTLALFTPMLITTLFYFILPESIRWLVGKGRYVDAEEQVKRISKFNNREVSDESLKALRLQGQKENSDSSEQSKDVYLIVKVFRHKPILVRCLVSPVWWITNIFIYYGLSINSVNLPGNVYLKFGYVALIEIPGYWIAVFMMERVGRKPVLITAFWLCAACQIGYILLPDGQETLSLALYMAGKLSIAGVMASIYLYTAELYPTENRHSLLAFSSMMGRIGSILAPFTPAVGAKIWDKLPFALFAAMALLSGLLVFMTPETLGANFPDTMDEAANIGKKKIDINKIERNGSRYTH